MEKRFEVHLTNAEVISLFTPFSKKASQGGNSKPKLSPSFPIGPFFKKRAFFWHHIYKEVSQKDALLHDKYFREDTLGIFSIKHLRSRFKSDMNFHLFKNHLSRRFIRIVRSDLALRTKGKKALSLPSLNSISPKDARTLSLNLRFQTGQKEKIHQGLKRFAPFSSFLSNLLKTFELPQELLAIAFVESTFQAEVESKSGAKGVWQLMPSIASHYLPTGSGIDSLLSPLLSSFGAFHLLSESRRILHRWDLTVASYNSGTRHFVRARRKLKKKAPRLFEVFKFYRHEHFGFASQNFYASFLAMAWILKDEFSKDSSLYLSRKQKPDKIRTYLTLCPLKWSEIEGEEELNTHLVRQELLPRGSVLFVKKRPPNSFQLGSEELRRTYPLNWHRFLKSRPCPQKI